MGQTTAFQAVVARGSILVTALNFVQVPSFYLGVAQDLERTPDSGRSESTRAH